MKKLHELIDNYFEERVVVNEESGCHCFDSFLAVAADLVSGIDEWGIEAAFPQWADDNPSLSCLNLSGVVQEYINTVLTPKYQKWSTITK